MTTTLVNADGTTLVATEAVTVTGPTVTGFSKTVIAPCKKLTTVVGGTGFDASAVVTASDPSVTVASAKVGKHTRKHPNPTLRLKLSAARGAAAAAFNVTVTGTGGPGWVGGAGRHVSSPGAAIASWENCRSVANRETIMILIIGTGPE